MTHKMKTDHLLSISNKVSFYFCWPYPQMKAEKKKYGGTKGLFEVNIPTNKHMNALDLAWRNKANPDFLRTLQMYEAREMETV